MLSFQTISTKPTLEFSQAWALYEEAFPPEERRSLEQHKQLLQNPDYQFLAIHFEVVFAGILGIWQLQSFTFLEHFAVVPEMRGKGVGSNILQTLLQQTKQPIILEVEPPLTQDAQRRISFYERLGFHLNKFDYRQPPYDATKPWVPLLLMSNPSLITLSEVEKVKAQLYRFVYQQAV